MNQLCPDCRSIIDQSDKFCSKCGFNLTGRGARPRPLLTGDNRWALIKPILWLWGGILLINITALMLGSGGPDVMTIATALTSGWILALTLIPKRADEELFDFGMSGRAALEVLVAFALIFLLSAAYFGALSWIGVEQIEVTAPFRAAGWPAWSPYVLLALAPAIFEELAFRGFIMGRFLQVLDEREALLTQASLFAIIHMLPAMFISHFFIGLLLGLLRLRHRSLAAPILCHFAWNAYVITQELISAAP